MCIFAPPNAKVAELVDALDSKSSDSNIVRVRFPPLVHERLKLMFQPFCFHIAESMCEVLTCKFTKNDYF